MDQGRATEIKFLTSEGETDAEVKKITLEDLKSEVPKPGEAVFVIQRNARDERDPNAENAGELKPEAAESTQRHAKMFFNEIFESIPPDELTKIDILVIASDAKLITPEGLKKENKRGMETAICVINGLKDSMKEHSVSDDQLINNIASENGGPVEVKSYRDLLMLEDSPEFVQFLIDRYGTGKEFWEAYESDAEKDIRLTMGAEGPEDIAKRMNDFILYLEKMAEIYQTMNTDRRLIIWSVAHYDSISPWAKSALGMNLERTYLPVESGAGVVLKEVNGIIETKIRGQKYTATLHK